MQLNYAILQYERRYTAMTILFCILNFFLVGLNLYFYFTDHDCFAMFAAGFVAGTTIAMLSDRLG